MIKKILAAAACTLLVLPAFAQQSATAGTGFYGGIDVGNTHQSPGINDTSAGLFGGYQFNRYFSAELGFRRLGDTSVTNISGPQFDAKLIKEDILVYQKSLSLVARYPVADKLDVYGRAGYNHIDYRSDNGAKPSANEALVGVGASYALTPKVDLRIEAQRAKSSTTNVSVGASYRF
ncbi:outer membrane beta-barrel protein [Pseudoduganella sp. OTU4001]|uniref:outer membrane beta-barrel protein n=1 Tax=Pseudoduganella sp. OTU4001 TaxID=3043854 RepID=UPI00313E10DA